MAAKTELKKFEGDQSKLDEAIGVQMHAASVASEAVANEREARSAVIGLLYPNGLDNEKSGVQNWEMPGGWILKIDVRITVTVDKTLVQTVEEELKLMPPDPDSGETHTLEGTVVYKPDFSVTGYKGMSQTAKDVCARAGLFTFKHGTPGVELAAPKEVVGKAKAAAGFTPFG